MTGEKKKTNWAGIAAFIVAIAAVPGVLINTYLDYKSRSNSELVQKSSHQNVSDAIGDLGEDVDVCLDDVDDLKSELAELRGFIKGRFGRSYERAMSKKPTAAMRSPASDPEPLGNKPSEEASTDDKSTRRLPASIDTIMEQVQSTGEVYNARGPEGSEG